MNCQSKDIKYGKYSLKVREVHTTLKRKLKLKQIVPGSEETEHSHGEQSTKRLKLYQKSLN